MKLKVKGSLILLLLFGCTETVRIEGLFENDSLWKYSASLSPDGRHFVFNVYQGPESLGGEDIYVSRRSSDGWSPAKNLGSQVNSPGEEGSADSPLTDVIFSLPIQTPQRMESMNRGAFTF